MNTRGAFCAVVAVALFVVQGMSVWVPLEAEELYLRSQVHQRGTPIRGFLFVIFDASSLLCSSCLDSFVDLLHSLPPGDQKENVWGVLVFRERREFRSGLKERKILEKKLRGFIKANRIEYPILVDQMRLFRSLVKEGPCAVLLYPENRSLLKYIFPLSKGQKEEIIRILRKP